MRLPLEVFGSVAVVHTPEEVGEEFLESFPDFVINHTSVVEKTDKVVIVQGVQSRGTHTGKPFTIKPGVLPAVEPSGKECFNDEELYELHLKEGKIDTIFVISMGVQTGFAGFYTRAGGDVSALANTKQEYG